MILLGFTGTSAQIMEAKLGYRIWPVKKRKDRKASAAPRKRWQIGSRHKPIRAAETSSGAYGSDFLRFSNKEKLLFLQEPGYATPLFRRMMTPLTSKPMPNSARLEGSGVAEDPAARKKVSGPPLAPETVADNPRKSKPPLMASCA